MIGSDCGPDILMIPIPPTPLGVAMAAIVSVSMGMSIPWKGRRNENGSFQDGAFIGSARPDRFVADSVGRRRDLTRQNGVGRFFAGAAVWEKS